MPPTSTSDPATRVPRIVAYAYDWRPDRGSEPGAGWAMVRMLAGFAEVWVVTRTSPPREGGYETWLREIPEGARIHAVHVPLPTDPRYDEPAALPWHTRLLPHAEYLLWQTLALWKARRLYRRVDFDLAWHLTWANGWLGSTAALIGPPFIYGPVGGGLGPPWALVSSLGARGVAVELARAAIRTTGRYCNPLARLSWNRARLILVQNPETRAWLPAPHRARAEVFQNAVMAGIPHAARHRPTPPYTALFAGRLVAWKGAALAVRAIARLPEWRLVVLGDGPEEERLRRLAAKLGMTNRVDLRGQQPRDEVVRLMRDEADLFLFPSLHDDAGLAVAEALASGVHVVALAHGGPAVLGATCVEPGRPEETVRRLAEAVRASIGELPVTPPRMDLESRREALVAVLRRTGLLDAGPERR